MEPRNKALGAELHENVNLICLYNGFKIQVQRSNSGRRNKLHRKKERKEKKKVILKEYFRYNRNFYRYKISKTKDKDSLDRALNVFFTS